MCVLSLALQPTGCSCESCTHTCTTATPSRHRHPRPVCYPRPCACLALAAAAPGPPCLRCHGCATPPTPNSPCRLSERGVREWPGNEKDKENGRPRSKPAGRSAWLCCSHARPSHGVVAERRRSVGGWLTRAGPSRREAAARPSILVTPVAHIADTRQHDRKTCGTTGRQQRSQAAGHDGAGGGHDGFRACGGRNWTGAAVSHRQAFAASPLPTVEALASNPAWGGGAPCCWGSGGLRNRAATGMGVQLAGRHAISWVWGCGLVLIRPAAQRSCCC